MAVYCKYCIHTVYCMESVIGQLFEFSLISDVDKWDEGCRLMRAPPPDLPPGPASNLHHQITQR